MLHDHPSFALAYLAPFCAAGAMWVAYNVAARRFKKNFQLKVRAASTELADLGIFHTLTRCTVCKQLEVIDALAAHTDDAAALAQLAALRRLYLSSVYVLFGGIALVYVVGLI